MSDEQMRIAIAEACGWHEEKEPVGSANATAWWHYNDRYPSYLMPVPDYCNDLNAMHEVENKLTPFQRIKHGHFLQEILNEAVVGFVSNYESELKSLSRVASATARQRAEILLRTLGKWEEA